MQVMNNAVIIFFGVLGMGFVLLGSFLVFKLIRRRGVIIYHG
jgi:hypothetical protein